MKISTRLRLAVYIPALMALVIIGALVVSYQDIARLQKTGNAAREIRTSITELNHLVFSYILYHEERPGQQFPATHDALMGLLAGAQVQNPDQQRLLDGIRQDIVTIKELFLQMVSAHDRDSTPGIVEPQGEEARLVGLLMLKSYEADANAALLRSLVDDSIKANETRTIGLIFLVIVLATIPFTIVMVRTRRGITSSLFNLTKGVAVIGSGNLDFRIDEKNNDEVGDLSRAFNRMTTNLRTVTASKTDLEKEIEERKLAEEALKESKERFRLLVAGVKDYAIYMLDPSGNVVTWNEGAENMKGYRAEEIIGKHFSQFYTPEDVKAGKPSHELQIALVEGRLEEEGLRVRKDGSTFHADVIITPIKDTNGQLLGFSKIVRDITERKQTEEALRETKDYLENLFNYANAPIIVWDTAFHITRFNHAFERLTELRAEDVLGKNLDILFPEDSQAESMGFIRRAAVGERWEVVEIPILRADGEVRTVLWNSATIYGADGKTAVATIAQGQDITERKQAEEALSRAAQEWQATFDSITDMVSIQDTNFRLVKVNRAFAARLGKTPEELTGKICYEVMHHTHGPVAGCPHKETLQTGQPVTREFFEPRLQAFLEVSTSPICDDNGKVIGSAHIARDITEHKRAEEAVRETKDYLENLFNYANAPIIVWDTSFRITRFNHAFERLTELRAEDVLGKNLDILFPEDSKAESMGFIRRAAAGERWEVVEIPILRTDGKVRTVLWNSATIYGADGKTAVATIAQGQDITERKVAEEALHETRDYLENLFNYANAPIIVWDTAFHITRFNHAFERLTELRAEDVLGKNLDILFPEDSQAESMGFIRRAAAGERWEVVEIPILRADGEVRTVLWNSATIYGGDGKTAVATIAQGQDITERKEAEIDLLRKTDELVRSNAELEHFAYIASHDLQEPLRMISSYVQLLANRYRGRLDKDADEFIAYATDGANRMQQLINDLLAYSRVGTRGKPFEQMSLETSLAQAVENLSIKIEESGARVTHDPLQSVYGDQGQIAQVLQNLIDNAIKFRGEKPPQIHVSARITGGECVCSVSDNGIGIDPQYQGKLFALFQRLHTRREYPGTGLGLAICKRIVERHGGRIWVEFQPGAGVTFCFTLPVNRR